MSRVGIRTAALRPRLGRPLSPPQAVQPFAISLRIICSGPGVGQSGRSATAPTAGRAAQAFPKANRVGLHTPGLALPLHLEQPMRGWSPLFEEAGCRIQSLASLSPSSPPNLFRKSVHSPYSSPAESGRKSDCWRQKSSEVTGTEPRRPPLRSPAWGSLPPWAPSAASTSQAQKATLHGWDRSFSTNPLSPWHGHFWDRYCPVARDQAGEDSVLRHTQHSTGPPWLPNGLPCSPWCSAHPRAPAPAPSSAGPSGLTPAPGCRLSQLQPAHLPGRQPALTYSLWSWLYPGLRSRPGPLQAAAPAAQKGLSEPGVGAK